MAWGELVSMHPASEAGREIDTRKRWFQLYPDARELRRH